LDVSGPRLDRYPNPRTQYYPHHPPLAAIILAGFFAVLGIHDWVVRLAGALFGLGTLLVFYPTVRRWYGQGTALLTCGILGAIPSFAFFAMASVPQSVTLFFVTCGLWAYTRWRETRRGSHLSTIFLFQFLAGYSDWEGHYLALVLAAHQLLADRRWKTALLFPAVSVMIAGVFVLHVYLAGGSDSLDRLLSILRARFEPPPLLGYLRAEVREAVIFFTLPIIACGFSWIVLALRGPRVGADSLALCIPLLSFDEVWLRGNCFPSDNSLFYLTLFASLAAALILVRVHRRWSARGSLPFAGLLGALFLAQGGYVLGRRATEITNYDMSVRLGTTLKARTPPHAKILVLMESYPAQISFYSQRHVLYHPPRGVLGINRMGPVRRIGTEYLVHSLATNPERIDWVAVFIREKAVEEIPYVRKLHQSLPPGEFDAWALRWGLRDGSSPLLAQIQAIALERIDSSGFTLYRIR